MEKGPWWATVHRFAKESDLTEPPNTHAPLWNMARQETGGRSWEPSWLPCYGASSHIFCPFNRLFSGSVRDKTQFRKAVEHLQLLFVISCWAPGIKDAFFSHLFTQIRWTPPHLILRWGSFTSSNPDPSPSLQKWEKSDHQTERDHLCLKKMKEMQKFPSH